VVTIYRLVPARHLADHPVMLFRATTSAAVALPSVAAAVRPYRHGDSLHKATMMIPGRIHAIVDGKVAAEVECSQSGVFPGQ